MQAQITLKINLDDILKQNDTIIRNGINKAFSDIVAKFDVVSGGGYSASNLALDIINGLIFGGPGFTKPFVNSLTWQYINSPQGRAELGFIKGDEPLLLLSALKQSCNFYSRFSTTSSKLSMNFFDKTIIRESTLHPAAGTGGLRPNTFWFDWIDARTALIVPWRFEKVGLRKSGPGAPRSTAIAGTSAGRMMKGGQWQVSAPNRIDLELLFMRNRNKILQLIRKEISIVIKQYLNAKETDTLTVPF